MRSASSSVARCDSVPGMENALLVANEAPTACNRQPFRYLVFDDPEMARRVASVPMGTAGYADDLRSVAVIVGDLSLVGPRPITERELIERYPDTGGAEEIVGYWNLPDLRPGLTGYWQISGRSTMSFDERIRLDTAYLTNWSLRLDFEILAKTARALTASRGAY